MDNVYEELEPIKFTEAERRCAAVMCLVNNSGKITNREIQNATGITMKTIQRTHKSLEESKDPRGTIERKERPELSARKKRSAEFIDRVRDMVEADPSRSMRSMAEELDVSPNTVKSCLNTDLHYKSYKMQMGQILGMAWLQEHCYDVVTKDMWPPSSPDLNPMDYFVWGYLEARVNRRPHTTKASLIASIREQFEGLPMDLVTKACGRFRGRITAVIEAEGNYID